MRMNTCTNKMFVIMIFTSSCDVCTFILVEKEKHDFKNGGRKEGYHFFYVKYILYSVYCTRDL